MLQTRRFARAYKKLHDPVAADVDAAVEVIASDPGVGEKKKGDLARLWVYKIRSQVQLYLLGYTRDDGLSLVYLEAVGPHENFYRDLKR
ncbi:type II toxin-antitoxin system RelE/ParE family toxin [Methylococcus mesophilus]|uniref:type II toxin-antitoxin system RelE/ParE family toxin n=1 Tax=Methylococcus mesophilus TaxID=2993564 RepID=UPI00224AAF22|nr:type II toxin-antitoxin system RelE/ParE family toxin [Methylococcus mesophilus]UZR28092.1 type II toxin-antitoxin system RelE/ParE family toxin [Methylococcus mesophilus]